MMRSSTYHHTPPVNDDTLTTASSPENATTGNALSKRTKITHRSNTPIMSNNTKKRGTGSRNTNIVVRNENSRNNNPEKEEDYDDDEIPFNINSPWVNASSNYKSRRTPNVTATAAASTAFQGQSRDTTTRAMTIHHSSYQNQNNRSDSRRTKDTMSKVNPNRFGASFQPYYTATERLWRFYNHQQLQQQEEGSLLHSNTNDDNMLWMDTTTTATTTTSLIVPTKSQQGHREAMNQEEKNVELEFIQTLHRYGWSKSHGNKDSGTDQYHCTTEGNFWLLLYQLRQLGMATLLWDNDTASLQQYDRSMQSHIESISTQPNRTPAAILRSFYNTQPSTTHNNNNNSMTTFMVPLPIQLRN